MARGLTFKPGDVLESRRGTVVMLLSKEVYCRQESWSCLFLVDRYGRDGHLSEARYVFMPTDWEVVSRA